MRQCRSRAAPRRAGRHVPIARPAQAVAHRHGGRRRVAHHQRDRERRDALRAALAQRVVVGLDRLDAADPGADDAADPARRRRAASPAPSQPASASASLAGDERELREAVGAARLLDREVLARARSRVQPPSPSAIPRRPRAQRSCRTRAPTPSGVTAPTPGDDDRTAVAALQSLQARSAIRSIASPTVLSSVTSAPFSSTPNSLLDDLRELGEVERVDVELLERRVARDLARRRRRSSPATRRSPARSGFGDCAAHICCLLSFSVWLSVARQCR